MATEKIKRIILYAVILLVCVYFYFLASQFGGVARGGNLGPDFWPKMLLGLTMAACVYEIAKTALFQPSKKPEDSSVKEKAEAPRQYPGLLAIGIIMTVAYVYFLNILGFTLCTLLYLALFIVVGRYRNTWVIAANSIVGTILFVFLFMKVVYVSLPIGEGPFQQFSLLLFKMMGIK
jgi:putative tricarboxylic transport membrane protein